LIGQAIGPILEGIKLEVNNISLSIYGSNCAFAKAGKPRVSNRFTK
jgi:hypothetical protein